ncbi:MAG: exodeoxyribonuclease VII large subunit [Proteobacteria bacterium]|nr:exodeoxyribonuclease VII large subunit [Pseudomonadota bacterium]
MPEKMIQVPETTLTNSPEITVSELSRSLKRMIETGFGHVRVRGEIGSCKLHTSGHLYLSLKDEAAVLDAVCWRGAVSRLGIKPETGMDVICTGKMTTYAGSSKYQLVIERMELAGVGALLKMLEERRKKLAAEGLFDPTKKRALPFLPEVIGVITSPTGAVIRDIVHRLEDRFPRRVLLWPVHVQGESAAKEIVDAIAGFNALSPNNAVPRPDILIVARGGGSLEDLMPFNEESVVRAVAASTIPIISAVGHETDTTLIDHAADLRAPTPTAAAEMAVPVREALVQAVTDFRSRLDRGLYRLLRERKDKVIFLSRALEDPERIVMPYVQRADDWGERLTLAVRQMYQRREQTLHQLQARLRHPRELVLMAAQRLDHASQKMLLVGRETLSRSEKRFDRAASMLEALSPRAVLGRGYGLIYDDTGHLVTSVRALQDKQQIQIELQDGRRKAEIKGE